VWSLVDVKAAGCVWRGGGSGVWTRCSCCQAAAMMELRAVAIPRRSGASVSPAAALTRMPPAAVEAR
jgi:hypothetical protein